MATFDVGIIFTAINNARGAFASVGRDLNKVDDAGKKVASRFRAIQVVLAGIAIGAGVQFSKTITNIVGDMELLIARLAAVEGGTTAARETLDRLNKQFSRTPFAIDAVANGFTRLRAAGLGTEEAFDTLSAGVDAVAAFGGSTQELNRFIIGLQQAIGKGTLSMEELRQQIGEAVPSAMRVLAREMDISIGELFTQIEKGAIDSRDAVAFLTKGLKEDFGGFAASLGSKIKGSIQGSGAQIKKALEEAFNVRTDAGRQTAKLIEDVANSVVKFIQSISQREVDNFFSAIKAGAGVVGEFIGVMRTLLGLIASFISNIHAALGDFGSFIALGGIIGAVLFGKAGLAVGLFVSALSSIVNAFGGFSDSVQGFVSTAVTGLGFGLIGKMLFGALGPAAIVAAVGVTIAQVGSVINSARQQGNLVDNLSDQVASRIGDKGVEEGKKYLERFIAGLEQAKRGEGVLAKVFGASAQTDEALSKARAMLSQLNAGAGDFFDTVSKASAANQKKMEEVTNLVTRTFSEAAEKLVKLRNRAETTTFSVGSQTAEKMRRAIDELTKQRDLVQARIDKFVSDNAGKSLTEQQQKNLNQARKELAAFDADVKKVRAAIDAGVAEGVAKFTLKIEKQFNSAKSAVNRFGKELQGNDGLDAKIQAADDKFIALRDQLTKVIEQWQRIGNTSGIERANAEIERARKIHEALVEKLRQRHAIETEIFILQQKNARLQIQGDITRISREQRTGLAAAFSSSFGDTAEDRKLSLQQGILAARERIKQLELEADEASPARRAEIEKTRDALMESIKAQQDALQSTTAAGLLAQETWRAVGDAIQSSIKDSLKDLIKGTFDAEKALLAFYDKITDAALDYLIELIKIQFRQQIIAASGSGGGGGNLFSFIGGLFANGAAFKGNVKPFANGDIIRGPTMFGMAGEAGDEAIMPLTRVGGQLGVRALGGGGDQFNITIQAIDTQTGAQFLQKNASQIVNQLRSQNRLNNGLGVN